MPFRAPQSDSEAMPSPVTITPRRLTGGEVQSLAEDYPQIDIVPDTIPEIHLDPPPAA